MNIVVPLDGAGTVSDGFSKKPKYLVELKGQPLINWMLNGCGNSNVYFVTWRRDFDKYRLAEIIKRTTRYKFILGERRSLGDAHAVVSCRYYVDNDDPLIIVNPSYLTSSTLKPLIEEGPETKSTAVVLTAQQCICGSPPFYAGLRRDNTLSYMTTSLSDTIFAGASYWNYGWTFVKYAEQLFKANPKAGKYHVEDVLNRVVMDHRQVDTYNVDFVSYIQRRCHIKMIETHLWGSR